jgi:DNA-binding transcriptional MocR family regulator
MQAAPELVQRCVNSGVFESGGGVSPFTAHLVAAFIELGMLDQQIKILRENYRRRRDILMNALQVHLPEACRFVKPGGGFFVWLKLAPGTDCVALLPAAEAGGVSYVPGERFHTDTQGENFCRLNFTMVAVGDLEEGAHRLGAVLRA